MPPFQQGPPQHGGFPPQRPQPQQAPPQMHQQMHPQGQPPMMGGGSQGGPGGGQDPMAALQALSQFQQSPDFQTLPHQMQVAFVQALANRDVQTAARIAMQAHGQGAQQQNPQQAYLSQKMQGR